VRPAAALPTALLCAPAAIGQLNVSGNVPVSTLDTAPASQSITALNGTAQVALVGQGERRDLVRGVDGHRHSRNLFRRRTTWTATFFKIPASQQSVATVAANGAYAMVCATGASHVRVRASAFTSGTITVALRAGQAREVPSLYAGSAGSAAPRRR